MSSKAPQKKVGQDFACKVKYLNPLPDLPFEPKLLPYPFPADRDYRYSRNSLYVNTPFEAYAAEEEHGVPVDLMKLGVFERALKRPDERLEPNPEALDPEDRALLVRPPDQTAAKTISRPRPIVPWLRRTEYISAETSRTTGTKSESVETKMGISIMKDKNMTKLMDRSREGQIRAIEHTFEYVADKEKLQAIKHPTDKSLKVAEVFPVFPDWELWSNEYTHAFFDADPIANLGANVQREKTSTDPTHQVKLEEALLKPMRNPRNPKQTFIAYYAPTESTVEKIANKRKRREEREEFGEDEDDEDTYEYQYERDFSHNTQPYDKGDRLFLVLRPRLGAFYNVVNAKINLRRKRAKSKNVQEEEVEKPSKILITKRPFHETEKVRRKERLKQVAPLDEDEEAPIEEELFIEKFGTEPFLRLEQVVINASDTRRKYQEGRGPGVLDKVLLIYALEFQQNIARAHVDLYLGEGAEVGSPKTTGDRNAQFNKGMQTFRLNDICYKPFGDGRCLIHSPLEYWASDIERLKADPNVRRTLSNASTLSSFNMPIPLRSVFGGVVWEQQRIWSGWSGIAGAGQGSGGDSQSFAAGTVIGADSIVITYFLEDKLDGNKRLPKKSVVDAWDGLVREAIRNMKSGSIGRRLEQGQQTPTIVSWRANAEVKHLYYKFGPRFQPLEAETLVLGVSYLLVFLYISLVMGKVDLVKSRFGLGFAAVMMVLSSLFMSVGLWTMLGVRTSLVPWEVLPFLIMAVGVENILVLTNAVVSTKLDLPVKERVGLGLSKVGVRMSLSLGGEMFFLLIGSVINIRALQEFCLFAAVSIVIDYFMQITFFACVLSLDIRRLELPAQRPSPSIPTQTTKTMSRGINDKTFAHWLQEKACSWSAVLTLGIMAFLGFGLYGSSSEGSIIIPSDLSLWEDSMAAAADAFWNIINPSKSDKYVEIQPPTYMTFVYSADSTSSTEPDYFRDQKISTDGGTNDDGSRMVDWDLLVLMASVVFVLNCTILSCIFLTSTVQWFSRRRISAEQSKQSQTSSTWQHKSINAMYWKASRHWDVEILHVAEDGTISWSCLDGKIHTRNCRTGWWATIADDLSKQHGQPSSLCYEPKKNIMVLGTKGGSIVVFLMEHKRVYALPLDIGVGGRQHPNGGGLLEIIRKTAPPVFVSASGIPDKPIFVVTLSEMRVLRLVFDEDGAPLSQVLVHKVNLRESGAICTAFLGYASDGLILGWQDGLVEILEQDDASLSMSSSPLPSSPPSPVLSPAETHVGFDHRNANDGFGAYFVNIRQLQGHKCAVTSLATENDHGLLATGDADGVIKVWDIHSGAELACIGAPEELEGDETEESTTAEVFHEAEITFLKFWRSGDMLLLISASKDETVLILEVTTSPLEESLYDMSVLGSNRRATGLSYPTVTTSGFPKADHSRTPTPTTPPVVGSIFMKVVVEAGEKTQQT
ncbi:hypothetical protein HK102_009194 [Quaeritorhiza haematococci]|nr:hypothetical protein HK102_009194 [Quaeritorhiza haematococci]